MNFTYQSLIPLEHQLCLDMNHYSFLIKIVESSKKGGKYEIMNKKYEIMNLVLLA